MTTDTTTKREAILAATLDLVAERGFHGTAMAKVAKRSGTSAGIIYHYFSGKDELLHELYQEVKAKLGRALLADYSDDLPLRERFSKIWHNSLTHHRQHPRETAFLEQYENSPYAQASSEDHYPEGFDEIVGLVQHGIREGVIKNLPLLLLYDLTLGVSVMLAKRHIAGEIVLSDELAESIFDACWDAARR